MKNHCLVVFAALAFSACTTFKPQALDYASVQSDDMAKPMQYGVYTPPGWNNTEQLPLIVFLHGGGDNHTSFEKFNAHQYFDEQISAGNMPRVVVVTPNGRNGFWENWADGSYNYRDWVLQKVMPEVQENYNTLDCPEHCHLAGISMGGFGVLRFAYFAKERFSSVSAISAPVYTREQTRASAKSWLVKLLFPLDRIFGQRYRENYDKEGIYAAWANDTELQQMRLQLIWGDNDYQAIKEANQAFHQHLIDNNVTHEAVIYQGKHKWRSWIPNFNRIVNFLTDQPTVSDNSLPPLNSG